MNNLEYHNKRVQEIRSLLEFLKDKITLKGNNFLSIGCGTAPEFKFLSNNFDNLVGIDQNQELIEFCRANIISCNATFENKIAGVHLEDIPDKSLDLVFILDIDSNIFITEVIEQLKNKVRRGGCILITERRDNSRIYNRQFIEPFIKEIKERFGEISDISMHRRDSTKDSTILVLK